MLIDIGSFAAFLVLVIVIFVKGINSAYAERLQDNLKKTGNNTTVIRMSQRHDDSKD